MTTQIVPKRALLFIDVQNEYTATGKLPIEYPPLERSLANIEKIIYATQNMNILKVIVQQIAPSTSPIFAEGSHGAGLHPIIKTITPDLWITKKLPSAFMGTNLLQWLQEHKINTLTIVGYMTQNCNESTVRQAMHEGFQVEYLHDASGAISYRNHMGILPAKTMHETACIVMQSRYAAVLSTETWLQQLKHNEMTSTENLYQSYQYFHSCTAHT